MSEMHPVQIAYNHRGQGKITSDITLRAYKVYCHVYSAQPALVDFAGGNCRGGFGIAELIAFLYAYPFPQTEWRQRVDEAFAGMAKLRS
jgi:hypothetical protein